MRADHTDAELFELMAQAGCRRAGFGVESGSQAVLDSIKKRQSLDDVRRAFEQAKGAIWYYVDSNPPMHRTGRRHVLLQVINRWIRSTVDMPVQAAGMAKARMRMGVMQRFGRGDVLPLLGLAPVCIPL